MNPQLIFSEIETTSEIIVNDPVNFLSIVSKEPLSTHNGSYFFTSPLFHRVEDLIQHMQAECKGNKQFQYFLSIHADDGSSIKLSSKDPFVLSLLLSDHTFNHNHYISRYLKLSKQVPLKKSPETKIIYNATAQYPSTGKKYEADLKYLLKNVFAEVSVELLSNKNMDGLQLSLNTSTPKHHDIPPDSDLSPLYCSIFQDPEDMYEYQSLIHLIQPPNLHPTSQMAAVSMYETPTTDGTPNDPVKIHQWKNVTPSVVQTIINEGNFISLLIKTLDGSIMIFKSQLKTYAWVLKS